ncbi:phosphoribosylamine--glycine ligase [Fervidicella metallireducens AeB]|uniref:Phosphoribosylamine--glycine ligase n=1 Tax=Fervidicella metallireducens AeB TaxID=1403537 RepID=A0A017RXN3_9CLOT|nr:phosphoribosylamine--glycine ligase [Fervidicella metallireducens]EYE89154.1 phosphoribosylamine--glycine ligase [Fervidicella metallireducens AeB]
MKVLVIGSGGREHAIAWKISQNSDVEKIYCAPGNGGTFFENKCHNINLTRIDDLLNFARKENIDLTVVGPEAPLVEGIVDVFKKEGLRIFGPSKRAAQLEGSKIFSKNFMKKYNVKTAAYEVFEEEASAVEYLKECEYPIVIKADGLAAGKGVAICNSFEEAQGVISDFMIQDIFKGAGKRIVIEEYLDGVEASILSVTDGKTIIPFISAKDHKTIFEGNQGPNTGGMGVIAPNPYCTEEVYKDFQENIMIPTLKGIQEEKMDFTGIIFFGIMITKKGVYLLEYNVRMGDPETEALLPLMKSDLTQIIINACDNRLNEIQIEWFQGYSCCVIASSKGYPGKYKTGFEITGIEKTKGKVFIAGAAAESNRLTTSGGRVLAVTYVAEELNDAVKGAYEDLNNINFEGIYYRKDIGRL